MAKIFNYTIIMFTLMILLKIGGVTSNNGNIINIFFNGVDFYNSLFIGLLIVTLGLASARGIAAGFLGRSISESYFLTPILTTFLVLYLYDFKTVLDIVLLTGQNWLYNIIFVIMGGLAAGYSIALVQFWRGNDI